MQSSAANRQYGLGSPTAGFATRACISTLALLTILHFAASAQGALPATPPNIPVPKLSALKPIRSGTLTTRPGQWVYDMRFTSQYSQNPPNPPDTPDTRNPRNQELLVVLNRKNFSVWQMLVVTWPNWAAGLCFLGATIVICRGFKRLRLYVDLEPGVMYCRQCKYRLANRRSEKCPQCCTELTPANRITGRHRPDPKNIAYLACNIVLIVISIFLWTANLPRWGSISRWFEWNSQSIDSWSGKPQWMQQAGEVFTARLVRVNQNTGQVKDLLQLGNFQDNWLDGFQPYLVSSKNGKHIAVVDRYRTHLFSKDKINEFDTDEDWDMYLLADDGRTGYGNAWAEAEDLSRYDLINGVVDKVKFAHAKSSPFKMLEHSAHVETIKIDGQQTYSYLAGELDRWLKLSPDKRYAVLHLDQGMLLWDMKKGRLVAELDPAGGQNVLSRFSSDGRYLATISYGPTPKIQWLVYDLAHLEMKIRKPGPKKEVKKNKGSRQTPPAILTGSVRQHRNLTTTDIE